MRRLRLVQAVTITALGLVALSACAGGEATSSARIAPVAATATSSAPPASGTSAQAGPTSAATPPVAQRSTTAPPVSTTSSTGARPPAAAQPERLTVATTAKLGAIVVDRKGMTLYGLDSDTVKPPKSNCAGDCAKRFPPLLLPANASVEVQGLDPALVGRTVRADGSTQLTFAGRPLYHYAGDTVAGDTAGHGLAGGFAVTATGGKAAARKG